MTQSRRRFAVALLAPIAMVLGACVFGAGDDDQTATATAEVTATSEPTSEPTAAATANGTGVPGATVELPPGLEVSASGTWERRDDLVAGDEVPDVLGVMVVNTEVGAGTLWSLAAGAVSNPDFVFIKTSPNAEYVLAGSEGIGHILHAASGRSFVWGERASPLLIDDSGLMLFRRFVGCQFWVVDLSGAEAVAVAALELPAERNCNIAGRFSPDGTELLVATQGNNNDGGGDLFVVDLESGEPALIGSLEPPFVTVAGLDVDGKAFLTASLPGAAWVAEYNWADRSLATVSIRTNGPGEPSAEKMRAPGNITVSPDGRWAAWSDSDDLGVVQGMGGLAEWPVTVIANLHDGSPVVRAQRAAISNGLVTFGWLADSSAVVVQSEVGFGLLGTDGGFETLPFPVASLVDSVPLPAPERVDRFAYNGQVVDAAGVGVGSPPAVVGTWGAGDGTGASIWWIGSSYGWGDDDGRLILVRTSVPGRDFGRSGIARIGLAPRIVTGPPPPYPEPIQFRIASDGDRLNVRAAPGVSAERLGQFEHGTVVTVVHHDSGNCGPGGCSILADPELGYGEGWWIYVRGEDGLEGWVSTEFVEWVD